MKIDRIIWKLEASEKTLKELSIGSGVPITTIWRLINNKNKTNPTYATIEKLSDYLEKLFL